MKYAVGEMNESNAIDRLEAFRIAECVYDLTTIATTLINDYNLDVDSRSVFEKVHELATEFEKSFDGKHDDYLTKIEEFGYRNLKKYFDIKQKYTGCIAQMLKFDVEASTEDEAREIVQKKLKDVGLKPCNGDINIIFA